MKHRMGIAVACSLLCGPALAQLAEYGIEGIWTVSTRDAELRGTVSPDGTRMVWGSDRAGGPGGGDLWQARNVDKRWLDPQPLPFNTPAEESEPTFSADGRWLYFVSDRDGGAGGRDLYRVAVSGDGYGQPEWLGAAVNTDADEGAPLPSADGQWLLFASNGGHGQGGYDLKLARRSGGGFVLHGPVPGVNSGLDEFDAAWLDGGRALAFARGDAQAGTARVYVAICDGRQYAGAVPWTLSFNTEDGTTRAVVADPSRPGEGTVTGSARSPRAGKSDLYRIVLPTVRGADGCMPTRDG
jgi:hypothetical protein